MTSRFTIHVSAAAFTLFFGGLAQSSHAGCHDTGVPEQVYRVTVGNEKPRLVRPVSGKIETVVMPNGFQLGILVEPATEAKYREMLARSPGVDELVKIDLFDMGVTPPNRLSTTWGGANSRQGFGPMGGANRVDKLGSQVELWFHKPVCVTAKTLEAQ